MEKINFVNNSTPALNATNLNKLQDNVEDEINEIKPKFNYSTTEEIVVGTWINNKPIYRKVFYFSDVPTGGSDNERSQNMNANVDKIVGINALYYDSGYVYPMSGDYTESIIVNVSTTKVFINNFNEDTGGWRGTTAYVTVEYTKTTD